MLERQKGGRKRERLFGVGIYVHIGGKGRERGMGREDNIGRGERRGGGREMIKWGGEEGEERGRETIIWGGRSHKTVAEYKV